MAGKQLKLVLVEGNKRKEEYKLDRQTIGIGRASFNQIVLPNKGVSPFHARITVDGKKCAITALGALEGVKVNGEKIDTKVLLPGDKIQIGQAHLEVITGVPGEKVIQKKEKTPSRKKARFRIPIRLLIILIIIFIAILVLDIHWLLQLLRCL